MKGSKVPNFRVGEKKKMCEVVSTSASHHHLANNGDFSKGRIATFIDSSEKARQIEKIHAISVGGNIYARDRR